MRIATIHSVHLPLFSNFGELFLFPQVILTAFIQKINSYFAIYLISHLIFSGFFPFLYIAVIFLWANRKRETAKAVSKESTRYKLQ